MIYTLLIVAFAAALPLVAPSVCKRWGLQVHKTAVWPPVVAGALAFSAYFIPNIHISSQTDTFQLHFLGGGVFCALLFIYAKGLLDWRMHWAVSWLLLFAWTSAFGVANELIEFALNHLGVSSIGISDTGWDLMANTSGALAGYGAYLLVAKILKRQN